MTDKVVRLGAGMAFWGDRVQPAADMVERADIDYLCCDHLAELTMSILAKQRAKNPEHGYTRDLIDLLRGGQGVFGIALGGVWRSIEGTLSDLPAERAEEPEAPTANDELSRRRQARAAG